MVLGGDKAIYEGEKYTIKVSGRPMIHSYSYARTSRHAFAGDVKVDEDTLA